MIRVLLCLLLLIAYPAVTKETKKFSIYIFLLDDKEILNESLESFEPKVYCPRGEILEALDFKDRKKIGGGTLSYAQVLCHSNKGYISQTDYDVHGGTNKEWYLKNKEKLLSLHEYGKIFSGAYVNPKSTSMLLIPYSVDSKNFQLKLILEAAIKKGIKGGAELDALLLKVENQIKSGKFVDGTTIGADLTNFVTDGLIGGQHITELQYIANQRIKQK